MPAIRFARATDRPLILHSWIRELRIRGPRWIHLLPDPIFSDVVPRLVVSLLDSCTVRVVCADEDDDTVLAWSCSDDTRGLVHYVYVKQAFRGYGLGASLVSAMPKPSEYSVHTRAVSELMAAGKLTGWQFIPLAIVEGYKRCDG